MPIIMATAAQAEGFVPPMISGNLDEDVLSDRAISQRVDMALKGLQADSE